MSDDIRRRVGLSGMAAAGLVAALVLATAAGGQAAPEPCPPGVPANTSIRGFDIEDGGGVLTATHTISLEARDRDGVVVGASFTIPPGATQRGDAGNPAFSFDRAGSVPVTASWSHYRDDVGTDCTATVHRDLRLVSPLRRVRVEGPGRTTLAIDGFQSALRAGRNYDRRPVQVRLRGSRHARLPLVFRQSARRIGRISAVGRCGELGCRFRTGN